MATYYVRKTGSDAAAGTSAGAAWLTIDKAANTVAAGDTVYVGAGVYRELVTMDTAGSSGSQITYIADVTGTNTGDAGLVIVTAHDDDYSTAARVAVWQMNAKGFITMRGFVFVGSSGSATFVVGDSGTASHIAYEGCIIEQCAFIATGGSIGYGNIGLSVKVNQGVTPTGSGLIVRQCRFVGETGIHIDSTNQASANINLKFLIENCEFWYIGSGTSYGVRIVGTNNTFSVGGVIIKHCTMIGGTYNFHAVYQHNTAIPHAIYNSLLMGYGANGILRTLGTAGSVVEDNNRYMLATNTVATAISGATIGANTEFGGSWIPGFMVEHILKTSIGWTPFDNMTPVALSGYTDPILGYGSISNVAASNDIYGNPRTMGRPTRFGRLYYMDASDAAVSDPGSVWTNEANVVDTDVTTLGSTTTTGSSSSNFVMAEGTNAPGSGATILNVYVRAFVKTSANTWNVSVYSDALAETLAALSGTNTTQVWTAWTVLTTPSGGWTWAKVQALEFKGWRSGASGTMSLYKIQISVDTAEIAPDVGAAEANTILAQKTSSPIEGTISGQLSGTGYQDFIGIPVNASSTTITVKAKYDANYTGTLPQLIVMNIPGVADQTDTMVAAANTEETLSVTFTPTSKGTVRVRIKSNDTSATGTCHFDTLTRT